jgi:choline dehydrogenase-like flavoprotein
LILSAGVDVVEPNVGRRMRAPRVYEALHLHDWPDPDRGARHRAQLPRHRPRPHHPVAIVRIMRQLFATQPVASRIDHETVPGPAARTDDDVLDAWIVAGACGHCAIGTCAMGPADDATLGHPHLQVRGAVNLRVDDASVLPIMVSGNLIRRVTALSWHAVLLGRSSAAASRGN